MTHLGDDLVHARTFVTSAMTDMDLLLSDLRLDKERAIETLIRVQIGAKPMQARGIYRAAQAVVESYQDRHKQPKIDGRLMALYKLVVQYSDGLNEIAPEIKNTAQDQAQPTIKINAQQSYDKAHATLTELLPLAREHSQTLEHLMTVSVSSESHIMPQISFESLMPEITDTALRQARRLGKYISISYAAENLFLENSQVEQIRAELDRIVNRLVKRKIGTPTQRQNVGLPRSGHIDVSATQGAKGLNIAVLCEGEIINFTPSNIPLNPISKTEHLQEVGT